MESRDESDPRVDRRGLTSEMLWKLTGKPREVQEAGWFQAAGRPRAQTIPNRL